MDSSHALGAHAASPAHIDTSTGLDSRKMAFWTFIGSECLLFGSLIATYMAYKGRSIHPPYPHDVVINGKAYEGILNIPLTSFSTFVLLMSSVCMVVALYYVQRGERGKGTLWLLMTALGGSIFLGCQVYEFTNFYHEGLTLKSNLFGSTFFVLTGFHGAHVTVGVIYLITLATMSARGRLGPERALNVEIAGLYWHFVDVIWIVIFPLVYLIR
ncbi:cytochrome c oxidase subunit 3 [Longimicrobium sp.]|uniref:cytochrome c oxidase subunit 3 n=1 Tax=Longimicrobium sp. TaxID=2029185 RepID=UPI002CD0EB28|nr:cytochrome c oxidase subunit 3 [Longimicrobium sp.]HSU16760.1 cytochrome c oxidase subunit 3 [Longimicrobium sp.]